MRHSTHGTTVDYTADWREDALCLRYEPELFFPNSYGGKNGNQVQRAKAICRRCPVAVQCLSDALSVQPAQDHGIAGATTPSERLKLRRRTAT